MPVYLSQSRKLNECREFDRWLNLSTKQPDLDPAKDYKKSAVELENYFDCIADIWWRIGRELGKDPTAVFAQTPTCAPNVSDMGLMLAWSELVRILANEMPKTLVICNDPWLFRHFSSIDGVACGSPPRLCYTRLRFFLRGVIARLKYCFIATFQLLLSRMQRQRAGQGESVLFVYGHPASTPDGFDGYFGSLMKELDNLTRVLHVDCPLSRARHLGQDCRTVQISAWGSLTAIFKLPFVVWRPAKKYLSGDFGWLVKRAAAKEGSTAQPAAIAWQLHCQSKWLSEMKPSVVVWPWENHGWEREFVREAKRKNVRTIGYQHSVVGTQMYNYSPASNPDGDGSLPDQIVCSGMATFDHLVKWGLSKSKISVGGALRIPEINDYCVNPKGAVFLALPFDYEVSRQMINVARHMVDRGFKFIVGVHPMTPYRFSAQTGIELADKPFYDVKGLSSLVFAATTVGLEAVLAGIPTVRFQPDNVIALNILPDSVFVPTATADTLEATLKQVQPIAVERSEIFAPVSIKTWKEWLAI